jgi:hypothetical protein
MEASQRGRYIAGKRDFYKQTIIVSMVTSRKV